MATRREFFSGAAAAGALAACPALAGTSAHLISAARIGGVDGGALWSPGRLQEFTLPARGHSPTLLSNGHVALIARQPGTFGAVVNEVTLDTAIFKPAQQYRFGGHAAAHESATGFVTGEFHEDSGRGLIAVRGARGSEMAHWQAGGIGPHDLVYSKDGSRLYVALGGLLQEPDVRSPPLNAGAIESSLAVLDATTGKLLANHKLPADMTSLSIRHLALSPDGRTLAIGMQDQDLTLMRPVVWLFDGHSFAPLPLPETEPSTFRGYIGSIAYDTRGRFIAATSPRGGVVGLWNAANGRQLGLFHFADACGLAASATLSAFLVTSGTGDIVELHASEHGFAVAARYHVGAQFDNHAIRV